MSATVEATPKRNATTWRHSDIPALLDAHKTGGIAAAAAAFPDKPEGAVRKKLASLGVIEMNTQVKAKIDALVTSLAGTPDNVAEVRYAIKQLRGLLAGTPDEGVTE